VYKGALSFIQRFKGEQDKDDEYMDHTKPEAGATEEIKACVTHPLIETVVEAEMEVVCGRGGRPLLSMSTTTSFSVGEEFLLSTTAPFSFRLPSSKGRGL
jgi:hypothetical protein